METTESRSTLFSTNSQEGKRVATLDFIIAVQMIFLLPVKYCKVLWREMEVARAMIVVVEEIIFLRI